MRGEISYDLVMEDDMGFVEGTYRLAGGEWQVFIFSRDSSSDRPTWRRDRWESGVTGIVVRVPNECALNKHVVEATLAEATGVTAWMEVRGPDSIRLR